MVAFKGHFDGHVIIPSEPVSLPEGRELVFNVEPSKAPPGVPGKKLMKFAGSIDGTTAEEMLKALEDCERIDDGW